ncbi:ferric reductase-like transmembrane domain-containing protein [Candidatus Micrarchaeota archaeon]|nr:ferric reductase-like transmembrane domain-containing protein [Candidatus Micrarchaeota archaeon]
MADRKTWMIILITFVAFLLFYTAYDKATKALNFDNLAKIILFSDFNKSLREINKVIALESIALITITFLLGPLSKIWPQVFAKYLYLRKPLGIAGFAFGMVHSVYSFYQYYKLDINVAMASPKWGGFVAGVVALFIFLLMTLTSTNEAIKSMGYERWKTLQRTGYIALFFTIAHFYILETKPDIGLDVRPYGLIFFYLAIFALLIRAAILFIPTHKPEDPLKPTQNVLNEKTVSYKNRKRKTTLNS